MRLNFFRQVSLGLAVAATKLPFARLTIFPHFLLPEFHKFHEVNHENL